MDFENYSLTINVKVVNDERIEVLIKTLKNFIPCHLDYIINHSIKLDTEGTEFFVGYTQLITSDELSMSAVYA